MEKVIPLDVKDRIEILDYLRGFALLGIILVNILPLLTVKSPAPHSPNAAYQLFLYMFVEGRFYTIFSFLFGVGIYLFLTRVNSKGNHGTALFLRRMLMLFIFGIIHVQFHPGEALSVYAICGIIILPFYRLPKKVNLILGILLLMVFAIFSVKIFMTIPLMLLGISAGQYKIFEEITKKTKQVIIFTLMMLVVSVVGIGYQMKYMPSVIGAGEAQKFLDIGIAVGPFLSAFYAGVLILGLKNSLVQKLVLPLKNYGRMALTNYILQTVFIIMSGNLFNLVSHITYIQSLYLCIGIYIIQLLFSMIWLHYFRFGPLEWIWRIATYRTIPPIK